MDKKTIFELNDYIQNKILYFPNQYKDKNVPETSFSNWNVRDVIGHINGWLIFSLDIMETIKSKKETFKDAANVDVEMFNKANYEKHKNESLDKTLNELKIILINIEIYWIYLVKRNYRVKILQLDLIFQYGNIQQWIYCFIRLCIYCIII